MLAESESHVRGVRPLDVETLRVVPVALVAICRRVAQQDPGSGWDLDFPDLGCPRGHPSEAGHRAFQTERLVEGLPGAPWILSEALPLLRMGGEQPDGVAEAADRRVEGRAEVVDDRHVALVDAEFTSSDSFENAGSH